MKHGGDTYQKNIVYDFSVSLNPFAPMHKLMEAGAKGLADSDRYPDPEQRKIRSLIGEAEGVPSESVLAGNGASELLTGVVRYVDPKSTLLFVPGYSGYDYVLDSLDHCDVIRFETKEEECFLPKASDLEKVLEEKKPELLFLCNPWNPTGKMFEEGDLNNLLITADREGIYVVLDESFMLLCDRSLMNALNGESIQEPNPTTDVGELIQRFPKVVVLKSFTKFLALPGVRMGYLLGKEEIIQGVKKMLPEWNFPIPAEYILEEGVRLSKDAEYLRNLSGKLKEEREYLTEELTGIGMKVYESNSCFLFIKVERKISEELLERGILIREYEEEEYPKGYYYRIAVKDHEANMYLVKQIEAVLNSFPE